MKKEGELLARISVCLSPPLEADWRELVCFEARENRHSSRSRMFMEATFGTRKCHVPGTWQ